MSISTVPNRLTRRRFLQWSQAAMAAVGAAPLLGSASKAFGIEKASGPQADYYSKLGVTRLINAAGTYTMYTASTMPLQVQQAVAEAAHHPVHLAELERCAGEYIAKKLRCEGAMVSCGASSALTLATAACVNAANSGIKVTDIPQNISTLKNEVIVQKAHRYGYDHAMYLCGVKIVEVVTMDDYKRAFTPKTVMTNFFNAASGGEIQHQDWLNVAHSHNVPCHIDAAADMPPISNLWKYTQMGFDLVCFSGGKGIRGPQNAGLLLGKKNLIDLALASNNPYDGVGRGMKVAKEQIIGMVAAVDWILEQNDEAMDREFTRRANVISSMVKRVPTMKSTVFTPAVANHVPHLLLTYDPSVVGITPRQVQERLRAQNPSIELNPDTGSKRSMDGSANGPNTLVVGVWMLQPGEEEIVGRALRGALMNPKA
jgi:uncharacterized pyridoxal phosphate-dependent enzyme